MVYEYARLLPHSDCTMPVMIFRPNAVVRTVFSFAQKRLPELLALKPGLLHPSELMYFDSLKVDARRHSYLLGRYVAKQAIQKFSGHVDLTDVEIVPGVFKQPVVYTKSFGNVHVSISHSQSTAAALAFPEGHPMAIDTERIDNSSCAASMAIFSGREIGLLTRIDLPQAQKATLLWCAKESLSKALKTGFTVSLDILEISDVSVRKAYIECEFNCFPQYKAVAWVHNGFAWAVALPKGGRLNILALVKYHAGLAVGDTSI